MALRLGTQLWDLLNVLVALSLILSTFSPIAPARAGSAPPEDLAN